MNHTPAWSPDGQLIAFTSSRGGNYDVYAMSADGSGQTRVTTNAAFDGEPSWAPFRHRLSVTKDGGGSGTVTSTPAGIDCGDNCSALFRFESQVTLTASPAAGSSFGGWAGDCAAAGSATTCSVTMDAARSAGVTFDLNPTSAAPPPSVGSTLPAGCDIAGTAGRDVITGTSKGERICGLGGNDVIRGLGGNDILVGGKGNDRLVGGGGKDRFLGGGGKDFLAMKDRAREFGDGGKGVDTARINRGDKLRRVEKRR
jgi:Ca2+-binding RTX toxin-like protein